MKVVMKTGKALYCIAYQVPFSRSSLHPKRLIPSGRSSLTPQATLKGGHCQTHFMGEKLAFRKVKSRANSPCQYQTEPVGAWLRDENWASHRLSGATEEEKNIGSLTTQIRVLSRSVAQQPQHARTHLHSFALRSSPEVLSPHATAQIPPPERSPCRPPGPKKRGLDIPCCLPYSRPFPI